MTTHTANIPLPLGTEESLVACENAAATLGWTIQEQQRTWLAIQRPLSSWYIYGPVRAEFTLSPQAQGTLVKFKATVFGWPAGFERVVNELLNAFALQTLGPDALSWPPVYPHYSVIAVWLLGLVLILTVILSPFGIMTILSTKNAKKEHEKALQQRQRTIQETGSELISTAEYVGGHPLFPFACPVILSLSRVELVIYGFIGQYIYRVAFILLSDIIQPSVGRSKSATEVYRDGYRTIDVYEESPFLSIIFKLEGETYQASFESFDDETTPQEWYNQINGLRYQVKKAHD